MRVYNVPKPNRCHIIHALTHTQEARADLTAGTRQNRRSFDAHMCRVSDDPTFLGSLEIHGNYTVAIKVYCVLYTVLRLYLCYIT